MAKKTRNPNLTQSQIWSLVACPDCRADIGTQCREGGMTRSKNHIRRVEAAHLEIGAKIKICKRGRKAARKATSMLEKADVNFYNSWEWKRARFEALKFHGRQCQCCGWTPGSSSDNYLVVDHIKPIRKFPHLALDRGNLQILCNDCNKGKSFRYTDDFRTLIPE